MLVSIKQFFIFFKIFIKYILFQLNLYSKIDFVKYTLKSLVKINLLYVKIFQSIASNEFNSEEIKNILLEYTDNVPWTENDIDFDVIKNIESTHNVTINHSPINSGLISMVFKGKINDSLVCKNNDNIDVAIKIKRKGIDENIEFSIKQIKKYIQFLTFLFPSLTCFFESIQNNLKNIQEQTNFEKEFGMLNKMYDSYKSIDYIIIPKPLFLVENAIVMQFVYGNKLEQISKNDYLTFGNLMLKFGILSIVVNGIVHADLHSGNILFIKEQDKYKLAILDFGMMQIIDDKFKDSLTNLIISVFKQDSESTAIDILNSGLIEPAEVLNTLPIDKKNILIKTIVDIVDSTLKNKIELFVFIKKLNTCINNNSLNIKLSTNVVTTQLFAVISHAIIKKLCGDNFVAMTEEAVEQLFHLNLLL